MEYWFLDGCSWLVNLYLWSNNNETANCRLIAVCHSVPKHWLFKIERRTIVVRGTQFQIQLQSLIKPKDEFKLNCSVQRPYRTRFVVVCSLFLSVSLHTQVTVFVRLFCSDACTNWSNNLSFLSLWIVIFHWLAFDAL